MFIKCTFLNNGNLVVLFIYLSTKVVYFSSMLILESKGFDSRCLIILGVCNFTKSVFNKVKLYL